MKISNKWQFLCFHAILRLLELPSFASSEFCCQQIPHYSVTEEDLTEVIETSNSNCETCTKGDFCGNEVPSYILYSVNPGEGFNLRRDIFIRIAPLIKALNKKGDGSKWILVLPPWREIPHWRNTNRSKSFPWSTFFDIGELRRYIPVIEWDQFLNDHGWDHGISAIYSLQNFPFVNGQEWKEELKLKPGSECDFSYPPFIPQIIKTDKSSKVCAFLRGSVSTLLPTFEEDTANTNVNRKAILFLNAEVILWEEYGGAEWWKARRSMKFAKGLINEAEKLMPSVPYIAVHIRRKDFLTRKEKHPEIQDFVRQIQNASSTMGIHTVFIASDADSEEITTLKTLLQNGEIKVIIRETSCTLSEGECAIIDQLLCAWSDFFIGTAESTFTFRIIEERLLWGKHPDTSFNAFCPEDTVSKQPTRWLLPFGISKYKGRI